MPTQQDIANALGVNQATVSLALRGDPSISAKMRRRVRAVAKQLGYRPDIGISALMARLRSRRKASGNGTIAFLIDVLSEQEWHRNEIYRVYYQGALRRCSELGFDLECFYLQAPGMSPEKIDRILYARGIRGVILAPPYRGNRVLAMKWERYACVGTGYAWEEQQFDRVANDHHYNTVLACQKLSELGYMRIGMCLPAFLAESRRTRYVPGFLTYQLGLPFERRLPIFDGNPGATAMVEFQQWYRKWRPDALLSLTGGENKWFGAMSLSVPEDMGFACLSLPYGSPFAGVEEGAEQISATAVELIVAQIMRNEYGPPCQPKMTLIEGQWRDGNSVRKQTHPLVNGS